MSFGLVRYQEKVCKKFAIFIRNLNKKADENGQNKLDIGH